MKSMQWSRQRGAGIGGGNDEQGTNPEPVAEQKWTV